MALPVNTEASITTVFYYFMSFGGCFAQAPQTEFKKFSLNPILNRDMPFWEWVNRLNRESEQGTFSSKCYDKEERDKALNNLILIKRHLTEEGMPQSDNLKKLVDDINTLQWHFFLQGSSRHVYDRTAPKEPFPLP